MNNEDKNNKKRKYKLNRVIFKFKKKGFTLIELLAVVVILGVILVVTVPTVLSSMKGAKEKSEQIFISGLKKGISSYTDYYRYTFKESGVQENGLVKITREDGNNFTFQDLVDNRVFTKDLINPKDNEKCDLSSQIALYRDSSEKYYYRFGLDCLDEIITNVPGDPEPPKLGELTPIKYDGTNWVVTKGSDLEWYDYDNQKWANAALLAPGTSKEKGTVLDDLNNQVYAMFVWIPRYSYTFGCKGEEISQSKCLGYKNETGAELSINTPGAIDIKFVSKGTKENYEGDRPAYTYSDEDRNPSNWYTHPAFWFDKNNDEKWDADENLTGIWIGKFETSNDQNELCYKSKSLTNCTYDKVSPRILPNVKALTYQNIADQFYTARKFNTDLLYGIDENELDSHMMRNNEWGAVSYLSQSKYGKYGNNNYSNEFKEIYPNNSTYLYTGRSLGSYPTNKSSVEGYYTYNDIKIANNQVVDFSGTGASTTGNIYGVYDMAGGAVEYVMGNYIRAETNPTKIRGGSNFGLNNNTAWPDKKYYDRYTVYQFGAPLTSSRVLGGALHEVKSWYGDEGYNISENAPFFYRGGGSASFAKVGIFYGSYGIGNDGDYVSFHICLSAL